MVPPKVISGAPYCYKMQYARLTFILIPIQAQTHECAFFVFVFCFLFFFQTSVDGEGKRVNDERAAHLHGSP